MRGEDRGGVARALAAGLLAAGLALAPVLALAATTPVKVVKRDGKWRWSPKEIHGLPLGDSVVFKNPSSTKHNFKPYEGPWNSTKKVPLPPGAKVKRTFDDPGFYYYRCTLHSTLDGGACKGMCGFVHVS